VLALTSLRVLTRNNDGAVDGGDTALQTGISGSGGQLAFNSLGEIPGASPTGTNYLVQATVANLVPGDTTTFSLTTADIDEVETGVIEQGSTTVATHLQNATLTLADHTLLQVGDQFTTTTPVTAVLLRFNLTRAGLVTVSEIRVNYTTGSGVVYADVTTAALYRDENNNGVVDGGDTALRASMPGSGGQVRFTVLSESPSTSGTNYLVQVTGEPSGR
jgi:hypothetical protein